MHATTKRLPRWTSAIAQLRGLWRHLKPRRRKQFFLILLVMLAGAGAEMATITSVLAVLILVADQERANHVFGQLDWLGLHPSQIFVAVLVVLTLAGTGAALMRIVLATVSQRFLFALGTELSTEIFSRVLRQPYSFYLVTHRSRVVSAITQVNRIIVGMLQPMMHALIGIVLGLGILVLLATISPLVTLVATIAVGSIYLTMSLAAHKKLSSNSRLMAAASNARAKLIQESFGEIRHILLERLQPVFEADFSDHEQKLGNAQANSHVAPLRPRYVAEAIGILVIGAILLILSPAPKELRAFIPELGAFALGAQRLLPLFQQVYGGWASFVGNFHSFRDVINLASTPVSDAAVERLERDTSPFLGQITFEQVSFAYADGTSVLRDVNLELRGGSCIGLTGVSGSGKSTFLDLLAGLIEPTGGRIRIDGRELDALTRSQWQAKIAYVPQLAHLTDQSILANIAFGVPAGEIDADRAVAAAMRAQIHPAILNLPNGYETSVGDSGIRLSAGQRQRIGLARAFYRNVKVLILDEAMNALDADTEAAILGSLAEDRELTVFLSSHRSTSFEKCHVMLHFKHQRIEQAEGPRQHG